MPGESADRRRRNANLARLWRSIQREQIFSSISRGIRRDIVWWLVLHLRAVAGATGDARVVCILLWAGSRRSLPRTKPLIINNNRAISAWAAAPLLRSNGFPLSGRRESIACRHTRQEEGRHFPTVDVRIMGWHGRREMPPQDHHSRLVEYRRGVARYTPTTRIASGGMGEVWRGDAIFPDGYSEAVAIKRVLPWLANTPLYREMLEDEARLGMLLRHPNIVRVYDARMQGSFILVMELVDGKSLNHVLGRVHRSGVRVPLEAALHIGRDLAEALTYAHQAVDDLGRELAIVHGDVSPHNVLVSVAGEVKLMDFGLARATANLAVRDPNRVCGKPGYVAPELVTRKECSQSGDLFALGVILWECLAGRRLFHGETPRDTLQLVRACDVPPIRAFRPDAPVEVEALLHALLTTEPEARPNAQRVVRELSRIQDRFDAGLGALATASVVRQQLNDAMRKQPFATTVSPTGTIQKISLKPDADEVITSVYQRLTDQSTTLELC